MMEFRLSSSPRGYQTYDASSAKKRLMAHFDDHQLIPLTPSSFLFRVDSFSLVDLNIYYIEFVNGVEFRKVVNPDDIIIHILLSDFAELRQGQHWKRIDAPNIFVLSPEQSPDFRFPNGGRMLVLQIAREKLQQHASQILQSLSQAQLNIPLLGFDKQTITTLQNTFEFFYLQYQNMVDHPLAAIWLKETERFTLSQILLQLQNNLTEQVIHRQQHDLPSTLNIACDLIQKHLDQPFDIKSLCEATACSARSLQYQFKKHFDCSPRTYYQQQKLDALRENLLNAEPHSSVTDISLKWGFNHSGRLAKIYKERFGELPSATLAKS
jgi:AraC-like DNA-binding protein